jgi:hypothetical protein
MLMLSPSSIYLHLNLLHSPFPILHVYPPHTIPVIHIFRSLLIIKSMFKGISQCIFIVIILSFGPFNPFLYIHLSLYLPPSIFQQLSIPILISSIFTDVIFYDTVDGLLISFPFHPSLSSIEQFHYSKYVLYPISQFLNDHWKVYCSMFLYLYISYIFLLLFHWTFFIIIS